jgi:hypothetical protein
VGSKIYILGNSFSILCAIVGLHRGWSIQLVGICEDIELITFLGKPIFVGLAHFNEKDCHKPSNALSFVKIRQEIIKFLVSENLLFAIGEGIKQLVII